MAKRVTAAKARANFKEILSDVRKNGERVKVTRYGRTAAWIVPVQDGQAIDACADELRDCAERHAVPAGSPARAKTKRAKAKS
jgi:prevent-host-death family protein